MEPLKYENGKPLKYEMGLATRKRHGDMARAWAVVSRREWVGLRLSEYSLSLLCLAFLSLCLASHFPFFSFFFFPFVSFVFCFLRLVLYCWEWELSFFFLLKFTWVIGSWAGWMMGFMIFGRRARAKNSGPKPFFFLILLAKIFFFWARALLALYLDPSLLVKDIWYEICMHDHENLQIIIINSL